MLRRWCRGVSPLLPLGTSTSAFSRRQADPASWCSCSGRSNGPSEDTPRHAGSRWFAAGPSSALPGFCPASTEAEAWEGLMENLVQPIARGSVYNGQLAPHLHNLGGQQQFLDPAKCLQSMIRALLVVKQVLRENGHIYIVDSNPLMRPLMREAARCSANANVWWYWDNWVPGTLTNRSATGALFKPSHQPNRRLFRAKGMHPVNAHCERPSVLDRPPPQLAYDDKWQLWSRSREARHFDLMQAILSTENSLLKLRPRGSLDGQLSQLRLLVVLDTTFNHLALVEAEQRNLLSVGLVNHNKDLSYLTYPVYARDGHPGFTHFFLDWLLKVVNARGQPAPGISSKSSGQHGNAPRP